MSPERPAHHRSALVERSPVYYGWVVVAAATITFIATLPGQTIGVSIFLDGIIDELGFSRSRVSTLYLVGTLLGSLVLPFVGRFLDRRGPRAAVIGVGTLFAFACVWMGTVHSTLTLLIGFTLIRSLGQGSLSLVSLHTIAIWFVRRRGLAIGLAGVGMATATAVLPTLIERLIEPFGWRTTYMILGAIVLGVVVPIGATFFRDRPERFGLVADSVPSGATKGTPPPLEAAYTAPEARRTITFWLFVIGLMLSSTFGTALVFHHYAILAEGGLGRAAAAAAFLPLGAMSAIGNLSTGVLIGRVAPRFLLSAKLVLLGLGLVLSGHVAGLAWMYVYGALLGLRGGMFGSLEGNVFAYYFGRAHIGAIRGQVTTAMVVGSAVGPLIFAAGVDLTGSYTAVATLCAVPPFALAVIAPFLRLRRGDRVR